MLGPGGLVIRSEAALSSIAEMSFLPAAHWGAPNTMRRVCPGSPSQGFTLLTKAVLRQHLSTQRMSST